MALSTITVNFASLLYLASFAVAQNLAFVRPRFDELSTTDDGVPRMVSGENVTIEWESGFDFTTLVVYQEVGKNLFQEEILARMYSMYVAAEELALTHCTEGARPDRTEAQWEVGALPGSDDLSGTFHFELRNGVDPECDGCSLNSINFAVVRRGVISSTTASSGTQTATSSRTTDPTARAMNSQSATAAVAGAQSTNSSVATPSGDSSNHLGVGLGVGLGLGIPLVLAIAAMLFCMRRRKRRRDSLPRGRQPSPANSPDRASGAWLYQDGRHSQQSMLFRPSTTARSEVSSWSHRSWIEPFEFEHVEMRDQDAISQLRQSIYSNSRSRRSQVSVSIAGSEWGTLEGIPERPQPVHHSRLSQTL